MGQRAIIMDRDGTVCEEVGYVNHVDRVRLLPRAAAAIRAANEAAFQAVVVTNQAGVARGYFAESLVDEVNERVRELLANEGARLDGIYCCLHHPEVGAPAYRMACDCRKPLPRLLAHRSPSWPVEPDHVARDLFDAVSWILEREAAR